MADNKKANVRTPSDAHKIMAAAAKLPYDLMGGTKRMQACAKEYLPQEPAEDPDSYRIRVRRSTLFNKYGKTVDDLIGKLFKNGVQTQDVLPEIEQILEDVDMTGRDLARFARDLFADAMHPGVTYLLVDYPSGGVADASDSAEQAAPRVRSVQDERDANLRPYWVHIKQENLLGWKSEVVNGVERLTRVQILEVTEVPGDDEWSESKKEQVKVLRPGSWEIWQQNDNDDWYIASQGLTSLDFIPLIPIYTNQTGFMTGKPALENLAELNLCHFQSSSDQRNILHVARIPILFGSGFDDTTGKITIGCNQMVTNSRPEAKLQYVEHTGKAIEAGAADLKILEDQMKVCAMEPLVPKTGTQTATAKAIDTAEAASMLQTMGETLGDCLELAMIYSMALLNQKVDSAGSVEFDCDFSATLGQQADLDALNKARQGGVNGPDISRETYVKELKRRDVLSEDFDPVKDKALIDNEGPSLDSFGSAPVDNTQQG